LTKSRKSVMPLYLCERHQWWSSYLSICCLAWS